MTSPTWHVEAASLGRYATGDAGMVERSSIEAHLLACEQCRLELAGAARHPADRGHLWAGIADRIDRPRRPLRWSTGALRVSLASPMLVVATLGVTVLLLAAVALVAYARSRASLGVVVAVAPLAPLVAVVAAFRPGIDPVGGLAAATPLAGGRLPFLRALLASTCALVGGVAATLLTPLPADTIVAWVLPGVAFAAVVIAGSTWVDPIRTAIGAGAVWWMIVGTWVARVRRVSLDVALDDLVTNHPPAQLVCVVITGAAVAVMLHRADEIPDWRTS